MKTPERDELLDEILSGDNASNLRETSLDRTLQAVCRQQRLHHTIRGVGAVAIVGLVASVVWGRHRLSQQPQIATGSQNAGQVEAAKTVPGTSIRVINDDELLAMFPGRPVALVGGPENRQFVLLDEKKSYKPSEKSPMHGQRL
jgi:hypothetical protein